MKNTETTRIRRCVIYVRVSSLFQVDNTSLGTQEDQCIHFAEREGWEVVGVYREAGVSGALYLDRPQFQAAIARIECGEADVLLSYRIDRASRSLSHMLDVLDRLSQCRGSLAFCDIGLVQSDPAGKLVFFTFCNLCEFERANIRERTCRGRRARALEGRMPTAANIKWGYRVVSKADIIKGNNEPDELGLILVDDAVADWIKRAFEHFDEHGSYAELARFLTESCVEPLGTGRKLGSKRWYRTTLRRILESECYVGRYVWGKTERRTQEGRTRQGPTIERLSSHYQVPRPREEWITIPCTRLVSDELWDRVQARLKEEADNKRAVLSGNLDARLLSGLLFCPLCGCRLVLQRKKSWKRRYYICTKDYCRAKKPANFYRNHNADRLEKLTLVTIETLASHPQTVEDALAAGHDRRRAAHGEEEAKRISLLEQRKINTERQRAFALEKTEARMSGLDPSPFDELLREAQQEGRRITESLSALDAKGPDISHAGTPSEAAARLAKVMAAVVEKLRAPDDLFPAQEKRSLLQTLVERIIPTDTGLELRFRHDVVTYLVETGTSDVQRVRIRVKLTEEEVYPSPICRIHLPPYSLEVDLLPA